MLTRLAIIAAVACALRVEAAPSDAHVWRIDAQLSVVKPSSALTGWVDAGLGKLRYSGDDRGVSANRVLAEYSGRMSPTWSAHVSADAVDDATGGLDLTEVFFQWRPIPRSANRTDLKLGFFHAPWSLENTGNGWTTPLTLSPSALNAWLGEEVRPIGAQWRLQRRIGGSGSPHQLAVHAAGFVGNDPAGSLLAWRGWSLHDRQSRLGDELPLPPLPQIQPGTMFALQDPFVAPWREVDGRLGYYGGADWRYGRRALVALAHYDNRADPEQIENGQYAWHTRFDQLAVQVELPAGVGLLAQWLTGDAAMGPVLGTARAVDAHYAARYILATKAVLAHRFTVRYETFAVVDDDSVVNDDNSDSGRAWTLAYRYSGGKRWWFGAQWLSATSVHGARAYFGAAPRAEERLVELQVGLRLGGTETRTP